MQHIARIQTDVHLHDSDAGFAVTRPQRTLNRCGTAPAWQ